MLVVATTIITTKKYLNYLKNAVERKRSLTGSSDDTDGDQPLRLYSLIRKDNVIFSSFKQVYSGQ